MSGASLRDQMTRRLDEVEARVQAACDRASRRRQDVQLVAVTKTIPDVWLPLLPEIGLFVLGENRPQELWRKANLLNTTSNVSWHLIGHLQRNKIDRTLPLIQVIHSVDSTRLLDALETASARRGVSLAVLLEVNTSGEQNKHGFSADEVLTLSPTLQQLRHVQVRGLMTMAALDEDPEAARPCFILLRSLRDRLRPQVAQTHDLAHLSMGMSGDFEVAIEEGATMIRVGSALFAGLDG